MKATTKKLIKLCEKSGHNFSQNNNNKSILCSKCGLWYQGQQTGYLTEPEPEQKHESFLRRMGL